MNTRRRKHDIPWILGISASHHNAAVCLLRGDQICAAIQEERLTGNKRAGFSAAELTSAIPYCLSTGGISASELDMVVLSTAGYPTGVKHNDLTLNPQLQIIPNGIPYVVIPHHLGHAVSVYALSGLKQAAILVVDGLGSPYCDLTPNERESAVDIHTEGWEHASLYEAKDNSIRCVEKHLTADRHWLKVTGPGMPSFYTFGGMYSAVAFQIFGNPLESGKVMGLAPYGRPTYRPEQFFSMVGQSFRFSDAVSMEFEDPVRWPLNRCSYENLAASLQEALQQAVLELAARLKRLTNLKSLCYAGGVALNCTTNELLYKSGLFEDIFIIPAAEDSGVAIGAAFYGLWELTGSHSQPSRLLKDGFGARYKGTEIETVVRAHGAIFEIMHIEGDQLYREVAKRLAAGEVCGWYDGPSELGPRALGNRSILADPRSASIKVRVNDEIKGRESFRPLAPVILEERAEEWFQIEKNTTSPFMLRTWTVLENKAAEIPAVIHVDGTARVQTVRRNVMPKLYRLIEEFESISKVPILLNTSFNAAGEPIVETPTDALWSFVGLGLDCLIVDQFIITLKSDFSSLLDLVPYVIAEVVCANRETVKIGSDQEEPSNSRLDLKVTTRWGVAVEQSLFGDDAKLLHCIDGKRNGWELTRKQGGNVKVGDTDKMIRRLISFRRRNIIMFRQASEG